MHEMQTIVTDVHGVCPSVCLSRMHRMTPHSDADLRLGFAVWGHSVQTLWNHFGHLFVVNVQQPDSISYIISYVYVVNVLLTGVYMNISER